MNGGHPPDPPSNLSDEEIRLSCLQLAVASSPVAPGQSLPIHVLLNRAKAYEAFILKGDIPPKETLVTAPAGRA